MVSLLKDTSERNCVSFETAVGGIEPPSPRLTVRRSTARPPLPTSVVRRLLRDIGSFGLLYILTFIMEEKNTLTCIGRLNFSVSAILRTRLIRQNRTNLSYCNRPVK